MKLVYRVCCLLLAVVFFYTAVVKGRSHESFVAAIDSALPQIVSVSPIVAWTVIALELSLAALLMSGIACRQAVRISFGLSIIFLAWHVYLGLYPGLRHCGCGAPLAFKKLFGEAGAGWFLAVVVSLSSGIALILGKVNSSRLEKNDEKKDRSSREHGDRPVLRASRTE